jgi:hypothetical protein
MKNQASNVLDITTQSPIGLECNNLERETQPPTGVAGPEGACSTSLRERTQELIKYYYNTFHKIYGYKPEFNWGKAAKFFEKLAKNFDTKKSKWIIESFLENPPNWNKENFALEPWNVVGAINKIILREENPW